MEEVAQSPWHGSESFMNSAKVELLYGNRERIKTTGLAYPFQTKIERRRSTRMFSPTISERC